MNFKTEFIQICFRCSADFIAAFFPFVLWFCNSSVIGWSLSINRALLFLFEELHACTIYTAELHACTIYIAELYACTVYIADLHACTIYIADLLDCMIYVHELKIKLLKSKFESCPVSSCSRSCTLE